MSRIFLDTNAIHDLASNGIGLDMLKFYGVTFADLTFVGGTDEVTVTWANGSLSVEGWNAADLEEDHFVFL